METATLVTVLADAMHINLYDHQSKAITQLKTGSILCGGVGSGKSRTAIAYYFIKECGGSIKINNHGTYEAMKKPKDLYIITTAKKRDTLEWEGECAPFNLTTTKGDSINGVTVIVDSWNNIAKYASVKNAFFIFDEQRLVGSGSWVKSFIKIAKTNNWILLSATPGDTWTDYIPVFIANGFYKNRTEFLKRHAVYSRFTKYPKIEKYMETNLLFKLRDRLTVDMPYVRHTNRINRDILVDYDKKLFDEALTRRWDVYENKPIKNISQLCYILRKIVNSDVSRLDVTRDIIKKHSKVIIFYNFNYELELLRQLNKELKIPCNEWNGHKHEPVPNGDNWMYLVQYSAGAEGWNCVETDTILFYSQNYSYKIMEQASGRIDRLNTKFNDLFYYHVKSKSSIDMAISKSLKNKKVFNIRKFIT